MVITYQQEHVKNFKTTACSTNSSNTFHLFIPLFCTAVSFLLKAFRYLL